MVGSQQPAGCLSDKTEHGEFVSQLKFVSECSMEGSGAKTDYENPKVCHVSVKGEGNFIPSVENHNLDTE
jgi:hypothetical protein